MAEKLIISNDDNIEKIVFNEERRIVNVVETSGPTNVITVNSPGPKGDKGEQGDSIFALTGSYYSTTSNIQVTGSIFATLFGGDGSQLFNIPTSSIVNFNQEVIGLVFPYIGEAQITGSLKVQKDPNSNSDFLIIKSGSFNAMTVNGEGVVALGNFNGEPGPVPGGIAYFNSEFWLGFE